MRTIERNYRKNPHTASFLQTFHTAIGSTGRNYREEMNVDENLAELELARTQAAQEADLLALVPETEVTDARTPGQIKFMEDLIGRLAKLDAETGRQAREFTDLTTGKGGWTAGRGGNASEWIDRMLRRERELTERKAPAAPVAVADGRYAVEEDGVLRFFSVKNGRKAGFVFLDIQASDDWHSIRNVARIRSVLALIAQDPKAAMVRYGRELGICGMCGRTLTDEASRAAGIGPVCASK